MARSKKVAVSKSRAEDEDKLNGKKSASVKSKKTRNGTRKSELT